MQLLTENLRHFKTNEDVIVYTVCNLQLEFEVEHILALCKSPTLYTCQTYQQRTNLQYLHLWNQSQPFLSFLFFYKSISAQLSP